MKKLLPIGLQLLLMELGPCLDEALLLLRKKTRDHGNRSNRIDGRMLLIVSMKMDCMMPLSGLRKHPDDDSEKP